MINHVLPCTSDDPPTNNTIPIEEKSVKSEEDEKSEVNIITNPDPTKAVPLSMKRKLVLRLSDAVYHNKKHQTKYNSQKAFEKENFLKQVIYKNHDPLSTFRSCKCFKGIFLFHYLVNFEYSTSLKD